MFKFITLTLIAAFAFAAMPTAAASGVCQTAASETACFNESYSTSGTCSDGYSQGISHITYAGAVASAGVFGMSSCLGIEQQAFTYTFNIVQVYASTDAGAVGFAWYESQYDFGGTQTGNCRTETYTSATGTQDNGCPVGGPPAALPWGQLLP